MICDQYIEGTISFQKCQFDLSYKDQHTYFTMNSATDETTGQTQSIILSNQSKYIIETAPYFLSDKLSSGYVGKGGLAAMPCLTYLCLSNSTKSISSFSFQLVSGDDLSFLSLSIEKVFLFTNSNDATLDGIFDVTSMMTSYNGKYSIQNNRFPEVFGLQILVRASPVLGSIPVNTTLASHVNYLLSFPQTHLSHFQ